MFVSISLLTNVFKAILNNFQILTILSLLATAFILVFNVLSFSTYSSVIYEEDIPEESCETILDCVLELYTSGAIGDDMDSLVVGRFIFDIVYVVFMELLFQSLVGGIMIDAFSELKENDDNRDEDKKGFCYICSMSQSNVHFFIFRSKKLELILMPISKIIGSGTMPSIFMSSKIRIPPTTQESSMSS